VTNKHSLKAYFISQALLTMALLPAMRTARAQGLPAGLRHSLIQEETTQEFNQRLEKARKMLAGTLPESETDESRLGPQDVLEITVFEAPEMNRTLRVSATGEISLQLLGPVKAAGLTPRELESVLQEMLRRTYMKDPHVGVFVRELQSHPVSVVGAVKKPGVYQIPGTKSVIELLSMAEGLADDAGDTVLIMRGAGLAGPGTPESQDPAQEGKNEIVKVNLKNLLESADPTLNVPVHPGDIVKVARAGIVYVVGEVKKPGGFVLNSNGNISVLQALALAEGVTRTSAKSQARIIRTDQITDKRIEIPLDLGKILASKTPDPILQPKDVVFVPNSSAKGAFYRGAEAVLSTATGVAIYRW
jgi:polysaccharide export outer membrane protein